MKLLARSLPHQNVPTIHLTTDIEAPIEHVFDLARNVDLHTKSMDQTNERAVAGVTSGLLSEGDRVTWRARHFGLPLELTVEISSFDPPHRFRDTMVDGPFATQEHDHKFESTAEGTRMEDMFRFSSPLGPVGKVVDALYLEQYMRQLLVGRNRHLKEVAESGPNSD